MFVMILLLFSPGDHRELKEGLLEKFNSSITLQATVPLSLSYLEE